MSDDVRDDISIIITNISIDRFNLVTQVTEEANSLSGEGVRGSEERSLLIEGMTVVGRHTGRDEDGVTTEEDWRGRVNREISTRAVSGTQTTIGIRGAISLSSEDILALKVPYRGAVFSELEHVVVERASHAVSDS
jgi:hypothetical protein